MPVDAEALLAFELKNRDFFEQHIQARAKTFYTLQSVRDAMTESLQWRASDRAYQYLIVREREILGRINLTQIQRRYFNSAMLGYRIGEGYVGQGVASSAVALILARAFGEHGLYRVEAQVRASHPASKRVLEKSGFSCFGRSERSMWLQGEWHDILHYEIRTPHAAGWQAALTGD